MTSKRHGFTLIELLLATSITAVIVGALGGMFVFVGSRAAQSVAQNGVLLQAQALSEELERTVVNAQSCRVIPAPGGLALKCILPAAGDDTDGDGLIDRAKPAWVTPTGHEGYGTGRRVWLFLGGSSGDLNTAATGSKRFWRAYRNDDGIPTSADIDQSFSTYYDTGNSRWSLIDDATFSLSGDGLITFTIKASKLRRNESRIGASDSSADGAQLSLVRTVYCRNWRR